MGPPGQTQTGLHRLSDVSQKGTLPLQQRDTHPPCFCWAALSCRKPLKGASPVPGPTITSGVEGLAGSLNWLRRTNMGTWSPTAARFRKCEHTPSCMRPAQAEAVMI